MVGIILGFSYPDDICRDRINLYGRILAIFIFKKDNDKMKNKLLMFVMSAILLLTIMSNFVSAEVYLWNNVIVDTNSSLVKYHAFYWFDDTSAKGVGTNKDVPVTLWYVVEALPYMNLSAGEVDWCNFSITHFENIYGTLVATGQLLNTTTDTQSYYFANSSLSDGKITINMKSRDNMIADMTCHYTDSSSLYQDNALIGRFATFMPSFECAGCTQYTLEEQSNAIEKSDEITANELSIYDKIQTFIGWNYQVWLIMSWVIKIAFIFLAVLLIFGIVYYFYIFLVNLAKEI
jgi:hypothetical protein